jgi:hypothetical protein
LAWLYHSVEQVHQTTRGKEKPIQEGEAVEVTRRAKAEGRMRNVFEARGAVENRQMFTTRNNGEHLSISYEDGADGLMVAHPRYTVHKDDLVDLVGYYAGYSSKLVEVQERCMWQSVYYCNEHGDQITTTCTCKLKWHYDCPTRTTLKVRLADLPNLPDGERYHSIRIRWRFEAGGDDAEESAGAFSNEIEDFRHTTRKIGQRKRHKGTVLAWSIGYLLGVAQTHTVEGRLLIKESDIDVTAELVKVLCDRLGGYVYDERSWQSGEMAILQLVEDSMSGLVGMEDSRNEEAFAAFVIGTKGKDMFMGMSELWHTLKEVKLEERPVCTVCGKILYFKAIDPNAPVIKPALVAPVKKPAPSQLRYNLFGKPS